MDRGPDFYLASSDYYTLEKPRRVWWLKRVSTPQGNDLLLARIDPPIAYRAAASSALEIDIVQLATSIRELLCFQLQSGRSLFTSRGL